MLLSTTPESQGLKDNNSLAYTGCRYPKPVRDLKRSNQAPLVCIRSMSQ
jgi:hypothetical protein